MIVIWYLVNGEWSSWGSWGQCSVPCEGVGTWQRNRSCSEPSQSRKGRRCQEDPYRDRIGKLLGLVSHKTLRMCTVMTWLSTLTRLCLWLGSKVCLEQIWLIRLVFIPGFLRIRRQKIFLFPLGKRCHTIKDYSQALVGTHLYSRRQVSRHDQTRIQTHNL